MNGSQVFLRNGVNEVTLPLGGRTVGSVRADATIRSYLALRDASYTIEVENVSGAYVGSGDEVVLSDGDVVNFTRSGGTKG